MISLNELQIKTFSNILVMTDPESRQLYLQAIKNEDGNGTENSKHSYTWDHRYNGISHAAKSFGFNCLKVKRGNLWEVIFVINNDELYAFFNKKNLNKIVKSGKDTHYLKLLNLYNEALDELQPLQEQICLFENENANKDELMKLAKEMLYKLNESPSRVVIFAFEDAFIPNVSGYIFNTNHQIVWNKDYSYLLDKGYNSILEPDGVSVGKIPSNTELSTKKEKKKMVTLKQS